MTDDVTTEVVVDGGCSGPNRRTLLRLCWHRADPLAVRLIVTCEPDHPALPRGQWSMLRDFLRYGCEHPTGDGDVQLRPDPTGEHVILQLRQGGPPRYVSVPVATMHAFLDATERIVPAGEERSDEALDALLERLLRA